MLVVFCTFSLVLREVLSSFFFFFLIFTFLVSIRCTSLRSPGNPIAFCGLRHRLHPPHRPPPAFGGPEASSWATHVFLARTFLGRVRCTYFSFPYFF